VAKNISPFNKGIARIFGTTSGYVFEFFIETRGNDYSAIEIHKKTNVSMSSLVRILPIFESEKIIVHTRMVGKNKMYSLVCNDKVTCLINCHDAMLEGTT